VPVAVIFERGHRNYALTQT